MGYFKAKPGTLAIMIGHLISIVFTRGHNHLKRIWRW